jgi:KDO2-lipid IV(A) lauroyltransferase
VSALARVASGLLVRALAALSPAGLRRLAGGIGLLAFMLGIRRALTLDNLRQALPEISEPERVRIARGAYRNMALAALESLVSTHVRDEALESLVTLENWDVFEGARAQGKGLLVATAHFGSWELLGETMSRRGLPIHVVAKPLKGAVNARIVESRLRSGVRLIAPRGAVKASVDALAGGAVVCMLVDQVIAAERGVFVPFFGRPASTTPALSLAAQRSGAPVVVAMGAREGNGLRLYVEGPFPLPDTGNEAEDLRQHTAQITAAIERFIRRHPDQWLWLHRRWKVQPQNDSPTPARAPGSHP